MGDPGNAADTEVMNDETTGYGSVGYVYKISKYEVTNAQYAEFLNAVAATDTNALYNASMGSDATFGGITRSVVSGSYTYTVKSGFAAKPVVYVSFWDSLRFANWLHNGQPTGAQDNATTENGAYTITAAGIAANSITRNAGATIFLPSDDEWYKAAYYDASTLSYNPYPFADGFNAVACEVPPGTTGHSANCWPATWPDGALTDVGAFTNSPSEYGTFDQGGNVWEWNEDIVDSGSRSLRGGGWVVNPQQTLAASYREGIEPYTEYDDDGFRVASIPEPGTGLLLACGLVGLGVRRRLH
jgi:formylglycine-generating enzyme required for sulfatase activity